MSMVDYFTRDIELDSIDPRLTITIKQKWIGDVGVVVWDSAISLSKYFDQENIRNPGFMNGQLGIEFGAGTGLCGLVAGSLG